MSEFRMRKGRGLKVLVTGGSGFIGNGIVAALCDRHPEWDVAILDRNKPRPSFDGECVIVDIREREEVERALLEIRPDVVVNTAGIVPSLETRYSRAKKDRDFVFAINYDGTKNVFDAARKAGCKTFVHTSSCTVVTDDMNHDYYAMNEALPTGNATIFYGQSKAAAEDYVLSSAKNAGLAACALRPATAIGPGDDAVIGSMYACIAKGEMPFIIGNGDNLYDFVYVTNVAHAHVLAVENMLSTRTAAGEAFFISNQEPIYFRDFMVAIWAQFGHYPPFKIRIPAQITWFAGLLAEWATWMIGTQCTLSRGSVKDALGTRYASNEKARRVLGYVPPVGLSEGLVLTCEDYKKRHNISSGSTILENAPKFG